MTGKIADNSISASSSPQGATLKAQDNGALLLSGKATVIDAAGNNVATKTTTALCRCGASKNKPFCDGSHNKINFDSSVSDDRTADKVTSYQGKEIEIHYNKLLCSHAAVCGSRLNQVFNVDNDPWITPDNASTDEIKAVTKDCPPGTLSYSELNGKPQHLIHEASGIQIEKNGPYRVSGVPLNNATSAQGSCPDKYVLCRCGASKNKPYCDGSHADIGWQDS